MGFTIHYIYKHLTQPFKNVIATLGTVAIEYTFFLNFNCEVSVHFYNLYQIRAHRAADKNRSNSRMHVHHKLSLVVPPCLYVVSRARLTKGWPRGDRPPPRRLWLNFFFNYRFITYLYMAGYPNWKMWNITIMQ